MTCDREGVPLVNGGVCLSARDLARYGLLFARRGEGVDGRRVGDAAFIEDTRRNPGPFLQKSRRYSRQTMTDGTWLGHGGWATLALSSSTSACSRTRVPPTATSAISSWR
ncbi:hypothetical protein NKH94_30530 [Mesorhizobium australicum]|uniref:hypothetical protein n=1 Tax=Mesorhizobium australicum TaxID=536018 RepID=UPI00333A95AC